MRISLKIEHFFETYFLALNDSIDQTWRLNIEDGHSRFTKSYFMTMIHHYDVINLLVHKGISKMNLTHHLLCFN